MAAPSITPLEALALFGDDRSQEIFHGAHKFIMDGPQMSPPSAWAPLAEESDGTLWFTSGEPGDPIEAGHTWVGPY